MKIGDTRVPARFWTHIEQRRWCWVWTGNTDSKGYGQLTVGSRNGRPHGDKASAHRFAYERLAGPIPSGLELDHLCREKRCCNPLHLEPVTHAENVRRGMAAIATRARHQMKTHCPAGHAYSGDNLYIEPKSKKRRCRTCYANRAQRRRRAKGAPPRTGAQWRVDE